jgi:hypothetical protein
MYHRSFQKINKYNLIENINHFLRRIQIINDLIALNRVNLEIL